MLTWHTNCGKMSNIHFLPDITYFAYSLVGKCWIFLSSACCYLLHIFCKHIRRNTCTLSSNSNSNVMLVVHSENVSIIPPLKKQLSFGNVSHQVCVYECVHPRGLVVISPGLHTVYLCFAYWNKLLYSPLTRYCTSIDVDKQDTFLRDQI